MSLLTALLFEGGREGKYVGTITETYKQSVHTGMNEKC